MTNTAEDHQEDGNIIQFNTKPKFTLLPGGKPPEDMLWLKKIPEGYAILCRQRNMAQDKKMMVSYFQVVGHLEVCSRLYEGNSRTQFWVHSDDFSRVHECLEVIPIMYPDKDEEQSNGNSDQSPGPQ